MSDVSIFTKQREENNDSYINGMRNLCKCSRLFSDNYDFEDYNLDSIHAALLRLPEKQQVITFFAFGFDGEQAEGVITPEIEAKINANLPEGERSKKAH